MKSRKLRVWLLSLATILITVILAFYPPFRSAAQKKDKPAAGQTNEDTARRKSTANGSRSKISSVDQTSLDKAMKELDESMRQLQNKEWPNVQVEIENAMKDFDAAKISREVEMAIRQVDMEKINVQVQEAMKHVNAARICEEVSRALKEVDMQKINREVQEALKEVNAERICEQVQKELKAVDMASIQKELASVKKINMEEIAKELEKVKEEMARNKIDMKEQFKKAGEEMKKAKEQLQLMKEGLNELEKDGLMKKGEKVNIEFKNGIMLLNGKEQTPEVSAKYKKYFGEGDFRMNHDEDGDDTEKVE